MVTAFCFLGVTGFTADAYEFYAALYGSYIEDCHFVMDCKSYYVYQNGSRVVCPAPSFCLDPRGGLSSYDYGALFYDDAAPNQDSDQPAPDSVWDILTGETVEDTVAFYDHDSEAVLLDSRKDVPKPETPPWENTYVPRAIEDLRMSGASLYDMVTHLRDMMDHNLDNIEILQLGGWTTFKWVKENRDMIQTLQHSLEAQHKAGDLGDLLVATAANQILVLFLLVTLWSVLWCSRSGAKNIDNNPNIRFKFWRPKTKECPVTV